MKVKAVKMAATIRFDLDVSQSVLFKTGWSLHNFCSAKELQIHQQKADMPILVCINTEQVLSIHVQSYSSCLPKVCYMFCFAPISL